MKTSEQGPMVFMIAGEASGDVLGADLMRALKDKRPDIQFHGVGGQGMAHEGLVSLFPMAELSVMGLFEVLPKLFSLIARINEVVRTVEALKPDVLVSIDAPDFCFRVAKKLKAKGIDVPVVHYVAPSVWAWRPKRAAKVARFLDHVLCLLPFEPPYFEREGLPATHVGHPVVTSDIGQGDGAAFRQAHGIADDAPVLGVLPGSRRGEVERLLPVFSKALAELSADMDGLILVLPTVGHVADLVKAEAQKWDVPYVIVEGPDEKSDAFAAMDVALAASGTVALELAMANVPTVIAYKLNALTASIARRVLNITYVSLINILHNEEIMPELLQENCTAGNIAHHVGRLFDSQALRDQQRVAFDKALVQLGKGGPAPGERAADVVLDVMEQNA